jgi:hypothetical protein
MIEEISMVNDADLMEGEISELESILPQQFYGARRGTSELKPFQRLMVAMMTQAVRCFQNKCEASTPAARKEFAEVRSWIFSNTENGVFCFRAVCDALELDPEGLRKSLVKWYKKRLLGSGAAQFRIGCCPPSPLLYNVGGSQRPQSI